MIQACRAPQESQAKCKTTLPLAPPLSRAQLREIVAIASSVGGGPGYVDLAKVHAELIRCFGTKVSFSPFFSYVPTIFVPFARLPLLFMDNTNRGLKLRARLEDAGTLASRSLSSIKYGKRL